MTNSNSNYQIGQATHREYEALYSATDSTATKNDSSGLIKLASLLGTMIGAGWALLQSMA